MILFLAIITDVETKEEYEGELHSSKIDNPEYLKENVYIWFGKEGDNGTIYTYKEVYTQEDLDRANKKAKEMLKLFGWANEKNKNT